MTTDTLRSTLASHDAFVRRIARALTHDWNEAEDLVQETWAYALERKPDPRQLRPWLAATVRGFGLNRRRGERRRKEREQRTAQSEAQPNPTELLALRQEVVAAVLRLEEPYRATVTKAYAKGLAPAEIAAQEGIAPGTVRSRLHRAHAMLESDLGTRGVGGQRFAVLAAPAGLVSGGAGALGSFALGVVGAAVALAVAFGLWRVRGGSELTALAPGGTAIEPVAAGPQSPLFDPPEPTLVAGTKESEGVEVKRESVVQEDAYWAAVRAARSQLPKAAPERTPADLRVWAALKQPLDDPLPELPAKTMTGLVRSLAARLEIKAFVSPRAERLGTKALSQTEWILPAAATGASMLDLLSAIAAGGEVAWEVRRGALSVGTWTSLREDPTERLYPIGDLLLDPSEYYDPVPEELRSLPLPGDEILSLLADRLGFTPDAFEVQGQNLRIAHCRQVHRIVADYLAGVRSYWLPLPEEGRPGRTVRIEDHAADRAVIKAVRARGGVQALVPPSDVPLVDHLRKHLAGSGIGVVAMSRAQTVLPEDLRFSVRAGSLHVHDAEHSPTPVATSSLWTDLPALRTNPAEPQTLVSGHPLLEQAASEGEPLVLAPEALSHFLRVRIAPESWDQDPANTLRVSDDGRLFVTQSPWVVEEIAGLLRALP